MEVLWEYMGNGIILVMYCKGLNLLKVVKLVH